MIATPLLAAAEASPEILRVADQVEQNRSTIHSTVIHYDWHRQWTYHTNSLYAVDQLAVDDGSGVLEMDGGLTHYEIDYTHTRPRTHTTETITHAAVTNGDYTALAWSEQPGYVYQFPHENAQSGTQAERGYLSMASAPNILDYVYRSEGVDLSTAVRKAPDGVRWTMNEIDDPEMGHVYRLSRYVPNKSDSQPDTEYFIDPAANNLIVGSQAYDENGKIWFKTRVVPMQLPDGTWFPKLIRIERAEFTEEIRIRDAKVNTDIPKSHFQLEALPFDPKTVTVARIEPDGSGMGYKYDDDGRLVSMDDLLAQGKLSSQAPLPPMPKPDTGLQTPPPTKAPLANDDGAAPRRSISWAGLVIAVACGLVAVAALFILRKTLVK